MRADWLWRLEDSPAQRLALAPLLPLEGLYRLGAWLHRSAYARGLRARAVAPCAVVSVGNPGVGGSGKTPLVGWLAGLLRDAGVRVAILSRGVGGSVGARTQVVSDGERILVSPTVAGDEPVLLARRTPGVPVLAGRNRTALALRAVAQFGVDAVLLDDGFQHHRLARDLDLVCIDAGSGLGNGHVLPRGPLREGPAALRHADAILWTRARGDLEPRDRGVPAGPARFRVEISTSGLRALDGTALDPAELRGRDVGLLASIARPDRLEADLCRLGARVVDRCIFPDHHMYSARDVAALGGGHPWVTTEKDAVKLVPDWLNDRELWVVEQTVHSPDRELLLDLVVRSIRGVRR